MQEIEYQTLETAINSVREKMIQHAQTNGYLDEGTIRLSQRLDQLIIKQLHLKYKSKKKEACIENPQYKRLPSPLAESIIA